MCTSAFTLRFLRVAWTAIMFGTIYKVRNLGGRIIMTFSHATSACVLWRAHYHGNFTCNVGMCSLEGTLSWKFHMQRRHVFLGGHIIMAISHEMSACVPCMEGTLSWQFHMKRRHVFLGGHIIMEISHETSACVPWRAHYHGNQHVFPRELILS